MKKSSQLGIILFFLVMTVLYFVIYFTSHSTPLQDWLKTFIPLIVFTGFFIFLIAAVLVALEIFEKYKGKR